MDWKALLIAGGVGAFMLAPVFKVGKERNVSLIEAFYKHTVFCKDPHKIREVMVEESYIEDFKKIFEGEEDKY